MLMCITFVHTAESSNDFDLVCCFDVSSDVVGHVPCAGNERQHEGNFKY